MSDPAPPTPCPRCGYELAGLIDSWDVACPLEGVCSECGLPFRWAELLNPSLRSLPGFFEHDYRPIRAFFLTLLRWVRPAAFWRWVALSHPVRPGRMALWIALALLLLNFLLFAAPALLIRLDGLFMASIFRGPGPVLQLINPYGEGLDNQYWSFGSTGTFAPPVLFLWIWLLLMPLSFAAVRTTLQARRVQRRHVARVFAYSLAGLPIAGFFWTVPWTALEVAEHAAAAAGYPVPWTVLDLPRVARLLCTVALGGLWLLAWWYAGVRHYLRLPHALGITLLLGLCSFLATLLLIISLGGRSVVTEFV